MSEKREPREWWLVTSQSMRDDVPETAVAYVFPDLEEAREFAESCGAEMLLVREVMPEEPDHDD